MADRIGLVAPGTKNLNFIIAALGHSSRQLNLIAMQPTITAIAAWVDGDFIDRAAFFQEDQIVTIIMIETNLKCSGVRCSGKLDR